MRLGWILTALLATALPGRLDAQSSPVLGTWKFDLKQGDRKQGPRTVIVRPDSSASYGAETVRWRMQQWEATPRWSKPC